MAYSYLLSGIKNKEPLTYPEIYVPNDLIDISCSLPPLPNNLREPKKPSEPSKPKEPSAPFGYFMLFIIPLISIICALVLGVESGFAMAIGAFLVPCISLALLFSSSIKDAFNYIEKRKFYEDSMKRYQDEMKKFQHKMITYNREMGKFNERKEEILLKAQEYRSSKNIKSYRKQLLLNKIGNPYDKFSRDYSSEIKRGLSEPSFFKFLKNKFDECDSSNSWHILLHTKVTANETEFYYPDIVVIYENIIIDVEIDEPYVYSTLEPIHYQDRTHQFHEVFTHVEYDTYKSIDNSRNVFFLDRNWCIIRFAEEQICTQPNSCFLLIKKLAEAIYDYKKLKKYFTNKKRQITCLQKWTYEESNKMANSKYRDKYLKIDYESLLESCSIDIPREFSDEETQIFALVDKLSQSFI